MYPQENFIFSRTDKNTGQKDGEKDDDNDDEAVRSATQSNWINFFLCLSLVSVLF